MNSLDLSLEQIQKITGDLCINPIHLNGSLVGFSVRPSTDEGNDFCDSFCKAVGRNNASVGVENNKLVIQCGENRRTFNLFSEEIPLLNTETKKNGIRYIFGINTASFYVFFGKI